MCLGSNLRQADTPASPPPGFIRWVLSAWCFPGLRVVKVIKVMRGRKTEVICPGRKRKWKSLSHSNSLRPHGLYSPWNSPGQNTGGGSLSLLQGIFPTLGSNPGLLHCRQILYQLSHKGSPEERGNRVTQESAELSQQRKEGSGRWVWLGRPWNSEPDARREGV